MLIDFEKIEHQYCQSPKIRGILHIGANNAEEKHVYNKCSIYNILWFEGNYLAIPGLIKKVGSTKVIQEFLSDERKNELVYLASNNASTSLLEPGTHIKHHPSISFDASITITTNTLSSIAQTQFLPSEYNFMNLDVQGLELKVLKGYEEHLDKIDYIYTEVNTEYVYKNCALFSEICDYLSCFGFSLKEQKITKHGWGDAFLSKH